ncbi:MAG: TonB-dependent receptor [Balneolales bacterium]|nr:TonB-dependent receptor [Balneolales bacterium]
MFLIALLRPNRSSRFNKASLPVFLRLALFIFFLHVLPDTLAVVSKDRSEQSQASVNGYITEAATGEAIWGANVVLEGTTIGVSTNSSGFYSLNRIPPGEYTILVSFVGFNEFRKEVSLSSGETLRLNIELTEAGLQMDEITVTSEFIDRESRQNIGVTTVPTRLIRETPAVLQADVFRSIQLLPGITSASDFSSGLYIRGGSPDQTLILLDNTTVYNPSHFFGFFSTFNPDAIRDVRVFKGGFPAEYGGRLGSVVDIYNKDGNRRRRAGTASVGLLSSRFSVEGPYSRGSYMLAVRRSTLEPLLWSLQGNVDNIPESFYFLDINGKLNFDASDTDRLSVSFYSGLDDVVFPAADDLLLKLYYGNLTGSTTWRRILGPGLFSTLTFTGSRYFNEPVFEFGGTVFERRNTVTDFSMKADLDWNISSSHNFKAGIWTGNVEVTIADQFDGQRTQQSRIDSWYFSGYLQDRWEISPEWIFTGGLRGSWYSSGDYFRLEPRAALEYRPHPDIRLQTAAGRYYQFKSLITNEAFSGFDIWLLTDDGVAPSYGDQFLAGVKWNPVPEWSVELEGFYRTMRQLFEFDPRIPDTAGLDYNELFRFGRGYAYGVELLLQRNTGRLTGFAGYTWGTSRRSYPGFNNSNMFPPRFDRIHDLNILLNYSLSDRWMATTVFSYGTGQAYTEPLGRTQIRNPFNDDNDNPLIVGRVNASRLPAYHRLDIGFTRYGRFFNLGDSELQLQLINVYSRRNVWFYQFNFDENPPERSAVRMLPIIPSVTYTVNF